MESLRVQQIRSAQIHEMLSLGICAGVLGFGFPRYRLYASNPCFFRPSLRRQIQQDFSFNSVFKRRRDGSI
ncbi:hypothetical protein REMIM1_PE00360 (plasmid) [Rhizobium etli bv. mimosae str. Mim1]|nr:hypothetical protein REMIM1_PE00360 [Rhizobium etli bv. mimosae str. Mim1]